MSQDNIWTTALWVFVIPAVVGVAASLLANILYKILLSHLESRKVISRERRRKSAEDLHRIIVGLHEGNRDKVEFYVRSYGVSFTLLVASFVSLASAITLAVCGKIEKLSHRVGSAVTVGVAPHSMVGGTLAV